MLVIPSRRFGQPIGPILNGQETRIQDYIKRIQMHYIVPYFKIFCNVGQIMDFLDWNMQSHVNKIWLRWNEL